MPQVCQQFVIAVFPDHTILDLLTSLGKIKIINVSQSLIETADPSKIHG